MQRTPYSLLDSLRGKSRAEIRQILIGIVEKGEGKSLAELKKNHPEDSLFRIGLKHVTITKKPFCEAMGIPVEAGCRYKRNLEKQRLLVESREDVICPFTKFPARLISTNPDEFEKLEATNQVSLF